MLGKEKAYGDIIFFIEGYRRPEGDIFDRISSDGDKLKKYDCITALSLSTNSN